jgi:dihydroorotate dehydrogenase (fumarate)
MSLATQYLGLSLAHPIVPGASPLVDDMDMVRRLEDAGSAAIVMHSLFEEQVSLEQMAAHRFLDGHGESYAEATSYFPDAGVFTLGPDAYLEQIRKIREAVAVPVIASLNGTTRGGWLSWAKRMEQAGANALELNLYAMPSDPEQSGAAIEAEQLAVVGDVTSSLGIPVAVKLSAAYSSLPHFIGRISGAGAKGVVLFNRLYQPDIDVDELEVKRTLHLSDPSELLLRLRWLAIVSPRTHLDLAASGGVHSSIDVVKALMAGATVVQVVSALLQRGPEHMSELVAGLKRFLEEREYESIEKLRGSMNLARSPNPSAYERANYVALLQSYHGKPDADRARALYGAL